MKIVFLDSATIPAHIKMPRPDFPHEWASYLHTSPEQVVERMKDADIAITNKVVFSRAVIEQLPKLKMIALTATGMDNIDLEAAKALNIVVKNVAGYSAVAVPEHVIGFIFALKHSLTGWYKDQLSGRWAQSNQFCYFAHPLSDIRGSTLGIIGKGNLGSEVARLASALGMKVLFAEHRNATACREGYMPFYDVLQQADVISLHCPLNEETRHIINAETLAHFKKGAFLINTGRGPLVDEQALLDALNSGHLGGAALDVLSKEPPSPDHPLIVAAQRLPNLIITPHIAWAADSAVTTLVNKVRSNIEAFYHTGK